MKTKHMQAVTLAMTTLAAALVLAGCKTSGYQQADKTGAGIANFRDEVIKGKAAVDSTLKSLDQIAATANTDPRKAFEQYSKDVANLESIANKAKARSAEMKEKGQAYFAKWEQELAQVKDENIRELALERKAKLKESFDKIREVTEPLKEQFDPWMTSLKDLQTYLANDLTVKGVSAARKPFAKAKAGGLKVQKSMDDLIEELNEVAAAITPAKVPPAPAK